MDRCAEGGSDPVEGIDRGGGFGAFDLGQERHTESATSRDLFEGELLGFAEGADGVAEGAVKVFDGVSNESFLAHDAGDDSAELVDVEGFFEIVEGVEADSGLGGLDVWIAGKDDDGDVAIELTDPLEGFDAVQFGHHEVEDDEVVFFATDLVLDEGGVTEGGDLETVTFEQGLDILADGFVVIDDEDADRGS